MISDLQNPLKEQRQRFSFGQEHGTRKNKGDGWLSRGMGGWLGRGTVGIGEGYVAR
jgi:hypothetical protein